jgi:hypothetical protein
VYCYGKYFGEGNVHCLQFQGNFNSSSAGLDVAMQQTADAFNIFFWCYGKHYRVYSWAGLDDDFGKLNYLF